MDHIVQLGVLLALSLHHVVDSLLNMGSEARPRCHVSSIYPNSERPSEASCKCRIFLSVWSQIAVGWRSELTATAPINLFCSSFERVFRRRNVSATRLARALGAAHTTLNLLVGWQCIASYIAMLHG